MSAHDVGVVGCGGRMGGALVRAIAGTDDLRLSAALEAAGHPQLGADAGTVAGLPPLGVTIADDIEAFLAGLAVAIDFSAPAVVERLAPAAAAAGVPLVVGTTGLSDAQLTGLRRAATTIPVVFAPNMSLGINLLLRLVEQAARLLGSDYDLEVIEAHHRHKRDAPSGTALRLAEVLAVATVERGDLAERARHGRHGEAPRQPQEIGIHSLRAGDIVGEHTVLLCGEGERIELTHRASSRESFAGGALRAARWITTRPPGIYDMQDVLASRLAAPAG